MKIKILYIIETLGIGGAENLLLNTVKFLNKNDFEPYVLYLFYDDDLAKDFEEMEVSVIGPIFDTYSCVGVNNIVDFFRGINRVRNSFYVCAILQLTKSCNVAGLKCRTTLVYR